MRFDLAAVDMEKLVGTCRHVDVIGFVLRALFIQELVDRIIRRLGLKETIHEQEQCLTEFWRSALGCPIASGAELARMIHSGIYSCESSKCLMMDEANDVADLSDQLGIQSRADAAHGYDSRVFRKGRGQTVHYPANLLYTGRSGVQLFDAHKDKILVLFIFLESVGSDLTFRIVLLLKLRIRWEFHRTDEDSSGRKGAEHRLMIPAGAFQDGSRIAIQRRNAADQALKVTGRVFHVKGAS